ncbi:MAG: MBL fold metallo-hydrolase, partial [Halobaculum sp.]
MRVSYQHANPAAGNESFLLRFRSVGAETPCLLVDAGNGVDLDALTEPDDRLVGICLTHAHLDHYAELADAHRDGAPVFTSPATAAILGDVLDVAGTEYGVEQSTAVTESLTPVDGWTGVTDDVQIHPVPAGHAPGAVGWLVAVDDGAETHNLLATGDFTERRVAGFPGFPAAELPPVDALFLTASTNESFESSLTEAVGTAVEHAHGGARTLVTTSGLVGVHAAYLLSVVVDEYDLRVPIRVVGQVAKLYERLQYDMPGVETITHFEDPRTCLGHGVITIAGPEIPIERSSGRLFGVLRDDPNGSVLQLVGSGVDPVTDAGCTLHDYQLVNHPRRETLTAVHDAVDPIETVIVHAHGGAKEAFNDLDSVVWGTGDTTEYTLYDGTHWRLPPWMNGDRVFYSRERTSVAAYADGDLLGDVSVPTTRRHHDADLDAEGVDTDRLAELLHVAPASGTDAGAASPDDPTADSGTTAGGAASPASAADSEASESSVRTDGAVDPASGSTAEDTREPEDTTMADDDDSPETPTDDSTLPDPSGPIRTTGAQPDAEPDELAREALADSDTTPEEFGAKIERHRSRVAAEREQTDADTAESVDSDADQRGSAEPSDTSSGTDDGEEASEDSDETDDSEEASEVSDETGDAGEASEVS